MAGANGIASGLFEMLASLGSVSPKTLALYHSQRYLMETMLMHLDLIIASILYILLPTSYSVSLHR